MIDFKLELIKGDVAPRYDDDWKQLELKDVKITEKGMASRLPLVDLQFIDKDGNKYFAMTSGRIINAVSAAIKGVNVRNHGTEEP